MYIHHSVFPPQYINKRVHIKTKANIFKWIDLNSSISLDQKIWDINSARTFLDDFQKKYGIEILKYFDQENDGRFKSDIWRLCVLYDEGGIYVDIDQEPLVSISEYINFNNHDFVISSNMGLHNISNGFIYAKKGSEIIKRCIYGISDIYENNGSKGGTHLMGSVVSDMLGIEPLKMPLGDIVIGNERCLFLHEIGDDSLPNTSQEHFNSFGVYAKNDELCVMNSRYSTYYIDKWDYDSYVDI